jgi:hypothetical protein
MDTGPTVPKDKEDPESPIRKAAAELFGEEQLKPIAKECGFLVDDALDAVLGQLVEDEMEEV